MRKLNLVGALVVSFLVACTGRLYNERPYSADAGAVEPAIMQDLFVAEGERPLILLMANLPEELAVSELQPSWVYHGLYASETTFNAQDYLTHNSFGRFTIAFQGAWGPYDIEETASISETFERAMTAHELAEHDFSQYDTNGDNFLTGDELMVMVVDNGSLYGGAVRGANFDLPSGLQVRMAAGIHGSHANLATVVHEVTHLLGTWDIYGSNCNSLALSLMSCTIYGRFGDDTVHLDPWHKMNLGWIEPRMVPINNEQSSYECFDLEIPQYRGVEAAEEQRPLLIHDVSRDPNEYLMVEFRNGFYAHPGYHSYESFSVLGIVVWSVRVDPLLGRPFQVPSLVKEDGWDATIWTWGTLRTEPILSLLPGIDFRPTIVVPNPFADDLTQRNSYAWTEGTITPTWQDGTDTGIAIDIGPMGWYSHETRVCIVQEGS